MRRAIVAVVISLCGLALAALVLPDGVRAKGGAVGVEPDAGEAGTEVELSSKEWVPDAEVRIFVAYSTSLDEGYTGALAFLGPVAVARSDGEGDWSVRLPAELGPTAQLSGEPGFLFFRAESDSLPLYLENANTSYFVLTVDGRRPEGAGEIEVSFKNGSSSSTAFALIGWRRPSEPYFSTPYGLVPIPFDTTISGLGDGEWEIATVGSNQLEPVGEATYAIGDTKLCLNPQCADGTVMVTVHRAQRVMIRDGSVVSAQVTLGTTDSVSHDPPPDYFIAGTPAARSQGSTFAVVAGAGAAFLALIAGGELLRRRLSAQ